MITGEQVSSLGKGKSPPHTCSPGSRTVSVNRGNFCSRLREPGVPHTSPLLEGEKEWLGVPGDGIRLSWAGSVIWEPAELPRWSCPHRGLGRLFLQASVESPLDRGGGHRVTRPRAGCSKDTYHGESSGNKDGAVSPLSKASQKAVNGV